MLTTNDLTKAALLSFQSHTYAGQHSCIQSNIMRSWRALTTLCLSTMKNQRPTLKGVVFDMDGTLTLPNLDFSEMYRRCEISKNDDILEVIATLPADEAAKKFAIIEDMETESTRTMKLMPGAHEVASWLKAHNIPMALVTRNTMKSAKVLQEKIDGIDIVISRDGDQPPKPDPTALFHIAKTWGVDLSNLVMVGDSPANDIGFGHAAGTATALIGMERTVFEADKSSIVPNIVISNLYNLPRQLWQQFEIESPFGTNVPLLKYDIPEPKTEAGRAAFLGDFEALRTQTVQTLNNVDECGNTPLIWAADAGSVSAVDFLLENGCDVNIRGYLGATAVCRAARRGHIQVLESLIKAGADLDIPNDKMQYPLHFAAFKENADAVQILLSSGANTKVLDRKGRIPAEDTKDNAIRDTILATM